MKKWCPKCQKHIDEPGTDSMFNYAKFWRDNKCYFCDTNLVTLPEPQESHPTQSQSYRDDKKEKMSSKENSGYKKQCYMCEEWFEDELLFECRWCHKYFCRSCCEKNGGRIDSVVDPNEYDFCKYYHWHDYTLD